MKYGILFMFSPFYEYSNLEYGCVPVYYSVQNVIRILVAAPPPLCWAREKARVQGALQLLSKSYGYIHFAEVSERVLTQSFVVLIRKGVSAFYWKLKSQIA